MGDAFVDSRSFPAVKFDTPGQTIAMLVENVERKNDTTPDGVQKTWANGDPMHVFVFTGNVDGETMSLWVRGNLVTACRNAVQEAGITTVVGAELTITYSGDGEPPKRGMNPPKLFSVLVTSDPF